VLGALLYAVAAVALTRKAARSPDELLRWVGAACVVGVFARVHYMLYPSLYSEFVYTGDLLRLGSYLLMLVGATREIRSYWAARQEAAVLEDRHRMARDLHDGLTQELTYISTQAHRMLARPEPRTAEQIAAAAQRHPDLVVVDWDAYARDHPEWFAEDAVHLASGGPEAMATLFHDALVRLGIPLTVTAVSPAYGRPAGGTRVTVTGTGFTPGSTVAFGDAAATGVVVESQEEIRATAPPGLGTVDVTVTSANGTSAPSPSDAYSYRATCLVPRVVGMRIAAARRAIASAGCAVGLVRRRPSVRARRGVVAAQRPAAGSERPRGAAVDLVVGSGRARR
jgi:hypothetical protein